VPIMVMLDQWSSVNIEERKHSINVTVLSTSSRNLGGMG
jgi:hypothetical protein